MSETLDLSSLSDAGRQFVRTAYRAAKVIDDSSCRMLTKAAEALLKLAGKDRLHVVK